MNSALALADEAQRQKDFSGIDAERANMLGKIFKFTSDQLMVQGVSINVVEGTDFTPTSLEVEIKGDFTKKALEKKGCCIKEYLFMVSKQKLYLVTDENETEFTFSILENNVSKQFSPAAIGYAEFLKIRKPQQFIAVLEKPSVAQNRFLVNQEKVIKPFLVFLRNDLQKNLNPIKHIVEFKVKCSIQKGAVIIETSSHKEMLKIKDYMLKSFSDFYYDIDDENNEDPSTILVTGKSFLDANIKNNEKSFTYLGRSVEIFKADKIESKKFLTANDYLKIKSYVAKNRGLTFLIKMKYSKTENVYDIVNEPQINFLNRYIELYIVEKIVNPALKYLIAENFLFIKYLDSGQYVFLKKEEVKGIKKL